MDANSTPNYGYNYQSNIPNPNAPQQPQQPDQKNKRGKPVLKKIALYILLACLGIGIAKVGFDYGLPIINKHAESARQRPASQQPRTQPTSAQSKPKGIEKITAPITSAVTKTKQAMSPFVISGIFMDGEKGTAIINNRVVEVGDQVDGATVKDITLNTVVMETEDKTITLKYK